MKETRQAAWTRMKLKFSSILCKTRIWESPKTNLYFSQFGVETEAKLGVANPGQVWSKLQPDSRMKRKIWLEVLKRISVTLWSQHLLGPQFLKKLQNKAALSHS